MRIWIGEGRKECRPELISILHSLAVAVLAASPAGVQLEAARQIHASYLIVQAPELCAVHVVRWIAELFSAAAVMLAIVAGATQKVDGGCVIRMQGALEGI